MVIASLTVCGLSIRYTSIVLDIVYCLLTSI